MRVQSRQAPHGSVDPAMTSVVDSLGRRFPAAQRSTIESIVDRHYAEFSDARIRAYVPIMVERESRGDLRGQFGAPTRPMRLGAAA